MHSSDIIKLANLGVNIEISKDSSLHPSDALEVIKIVAEIGSQITIKKKYHTDYLIQMAEVGRDHVTIAV
ncbi:hypothetical protein [Vibrio splendidus]|uniref:hypothetical protein n=1 Tax=Vibrio splendidus TaxID=29497 RepID=UPI000D34E84E|nr:hypothetical protein [Vibrio splendidus]MBT9242600.1 hypothetical protein [Vibrio splendidus]MDP2616378.1 hypothetical protein [Vibrio splendidus]PTP73427.1 hypothetical protein CWO06_17705 [Vibrio splendidus]